MELQERSEMHDTEWVALRDDAPAAEPKTEPAPEPEAEPEPEDVLDQRCVSEGGDDLSRLRALEARVGDVLNTPVVSLLSQIALEAAVLV